MNIRDRLVKAIRKKYEADMETALATIDIYLANSVGIGEHPQHIQEIDKLLSQYCSAKEKLESLIKHFDDSEIPF
jgi:DNA repair exonuclease SbcCD ATPase subunit